MERSRSFSLTLLMALSMVLGGCGTNDADQEDLQQPIIGQRVTPDLFDSPFYKKSVLVNGKCSGTILRNEWVLTAKHCLIEGSRPFIKTPDGTRYEGGDTEQHPTLDVALIKLNHPNQVTLRCSFRGDRSYSCPREDLYLYPKEFLVGQEVTCFGYGAWGGRDAASGLGYTQYRVNSTNSQGYVYWTDVYGREAKTPVDDGGSCFYGNKLIDVQNEAFFFKDGGIPRTPVSYSLASSTIREWVLNQMDESLPRIGGESDKRSWSLAYAFLPPGQLIEAGWEGGLNRKKTFMISVTEGQPEVRWNSTRGKLELFSLNKTPSGLFIHQDEVGNTSPSILIPSYSKPSWDSSLPNTYPISPPAAVERTVSQETFVFWQTSAHEIAYNIRSDRTNKWGGTITIPYSLFGLSSQPAVVVENGGVIHLFARAGSRLESLFYVRSDDGRKWSGWNDGFGGRITSAPGAAIVNGVIVFAARAPGPGPGENSGIWYTKYKPGDPIRYGWRYINASNRIMVAGESHGPTSGPAVVNFEERTYIYYLNEYAQLCNVYEKTKGGDDWYPGSCFVLK